MASFPFFTPWLHLRTFVAGKLLIISCLSAVITSKATTPSVRVNMVILSSSDVSLNDLRTLVNNS